MRDGPKEVCVYESKKESMTEIWWRVSVKEKERNIERVLEKEREERVERGRRVENTTEKKEGKGN